MDPLDIFYDIHELIIQHFNYEEIMKLWKVSNLWCELILEKSKYAMKKVRLHIEGCNHDEVLEILQNKDSTINTDLFELLKTKRKYQNVKINIDHGWDYIEELVRNLASYLVDVDVSSDIYVADVKFPNLLYLKLDNTLLDGITVNCRQLISLSASQTGKELWMKRESPQAIRNLFKINENLKILELDEVLTKILFSNELKKVPFALQQLHIKCQQSFNEEIYENVRKFLAHHSKSLNHLQIGNVNDITLSWIYENLKSLKIFQFQIYFENNPRDFQLPINECINALDFNFTSFWQWTINIKFPLRQAIASAPNVEILILRMSSPLDHDDFRFILLNAMKLRKFKQNVDCLDTYRQLYEQTRINENASEIVSFSNISI